MLFLRPTHLTLATPGNTTKDSIETNEKASPTDTTKDSIEAQEKTSSTVTAMDSIETAGEDIVHGYGHGQYRDVGEGFSQEYDRGQYRSAGEAFAHGYDRRSRQVSYGDVSPLYDGREYAGLAQFESGNAPSSDHAPYRQQSHSRIAPLHQAAAQSPQPMYHQYGSPPPCAGAPLPNQQRPNYKPSALRWPFLSLLFIALVAFMGLLAYAMYALPQRDILSELINSTSKPDTVRRQVGDAVEIVDGTAKSSSPGAPEEPDYSEVSGIMVTHSVTMMQVHRSSHDGSVGKRANSVSVSNQTTPEITPTRPTDDSGDTSITGGPVIITTVPSESYGDISVTMTLPLEKSNSVSVLTQTTPETVPTKPTDVSSDISTTDTPVVVIAPPGSYGDISVTMTKSIYYTRPSESYGDISVTILPLEKSNSVPVSTQTTSETVPARPTDDSDDIFTTGPPIITTIPSETDATVAPESYGDISATVTESFVWTRPLDNFGDVSVTVSLPLEKSNSVSVLTQTTPETVPTRPTDDSGDISIIGPPVIITTVPSESYGDIFAIVTETRPRDSFGDVSVTVTFPLEESNSVSVSTQTTPETVPTRPTDNSDDISTTGPPIIITTVPSESYRDISATVTESVYWTRPLDSFGDVSVTVTFPLEESNSVSVSTQTTPETVPARPTNDSDDVSTTGPPIIITTMPSESYATVVPESHGDVSATVTFLFGKSNSVSVSTQTIPDIFPTRSTDDSGNISTTGLPIGATTVPPPGNHGNTFSTVTVNRPWDSFGGISVTVTFPPKKSNLVSVSTQTIPDIFPTMPTVTPGNYGTLSGSVTESPPPSTRSPSNFGGVTVTLTFPPIKSNSVSGSTQTTPKIVPTRPTDDYGDISSTNPPGTRPPDDSGDVSVTETFPPVETRLPDDSGRVDPVITTLTVNPTDNRDVEVVQTLVLTPTLAVETDANGIPTATLTKYPSFTSVIPTSHTTVLTNSLGQPTGTVVTDALLTPSITVETDPNGIPTATRTSYDIIPTKEPDSTVVRVWHMTYGEYFIGMFLPTILAMAISIPIRILDLNVKLLQPWHELTKPGGASGRRSLCLETGGWWGLINAVRWVFGGHVLIVLTTSLVLASALLVPLSSEAIAFDLQGTCVKGSGNAKGCVYVVSVFREAAGGTLALLALMAMMVFTILCYLVKWQTGVWANPWSICGISSLSLNEDVRKLFPSHADGGAAGKTPDELMRSILKDHCFSLGYFKNSEGGLEYGIMLQKNDVVEPYLEGVRDENTPPLDRTHWYNGQTRTGKKHHQPFFMLKYSGRALLLILLCGILALILYYNNTGGETPFEYFMMSESFGVRFLFSGVGFIITLCWSSFFDSVAVLSPYHLLAQAPQSAQRSILLAPPTNAFSGLWSAVRRRDGFLAVVAFTSVLSELLPVLLAEIPFRVSQTYLVHLITTWSAVGILCIMLLVLVSSFFVKWPHMPLDPTTVAGAMYYVADSWMLGLFEGLGTLGPKDRDRRVVGLGLKYRFGPMTGVSWETRVGVDVAGDLSSIAGW
ncbi:hypothetical protein DL767_001037 [Monosporascus sp. MG133]|nr:hypothetical protein DL767_001037 [Monosporascus sp. MG133]